MNDDDLRQRFDELRMEESRRVPPFAVPRPQPRARWRLQLAAAALLLLIIVAVTLSTRRETTFSPADHAVAQSISAWRAPTDVLLETPGREVLRSSPSIPDLHLPTEGAMP